MKISASRFSFWLFCLFCPCAHAQTSTPSTQKPPARVPVAVKIDARAAREMVARVLRETSALRQLPIQSAVKSGVKTRAQVEAMLRGKVKSELPSDQVVASQIFVRQLGLAPADFDLRSTYITLMAEQIAGYYDTKTKTFVTTDRVDKAQLETVMAHELTHALQDQHFDLSRLEKWPDHDSDARLAMSALVEGDATLLMSRYMAQNPWRFLGMALSSLKSAQGADSNFARAPRIVRDSVTFPYVQGMEFVSNLYRRGGWPQVSAAFTRLPQSSEQILHFDKYLAREAPLQVELRDLSRVLGTNWKLLDHDVNGEIGLFLTVAEHLGDDNAAREAAKGWAGDRYSVYRGAKNSVLVVQDCRFDSQFDARQWRETYARGTSKRLGFKAQQRGALQVWNAAPKGVWMQQKGNRVLILEGTVGKFSPATVLGNLWR